ncbi:MAG: hypothetical protein GDA49_08505 [Rhodospirillales bacterium]|nr:hypothetical protein [Rhodospirillales bacterium]
MRDTAVIAALRAHGRHIAPDHGTGLARELARIAQHGELGIRETGFERTGLERRQDDIGTRIAQGCADPLEAHLKLGQSILVGNHGDPRRHGPISRINAR